MLQLLNARVVGLEADPATLFRGNSLASKAMDHVRVLHKYFPFVGCLHLQIHILRLFSQLLDSQLHPSAPSHPRST